MSIFQRKLPPRASQTRSPGATLPPAHLPPAGPSQSFPGPSLPQPLSMPVQPVQILRLQEPITSPPDMANPQVRKGFPFCEKVQTACMWLTKCCASAEQYVTSGYLADIVQSQAAQIQAAAFDPLVAMLQRKAVFLKIHDTNGLELDPYVIHPFVKVHVIDVTTGCYLRKESPRPVLSPYEEMGQIGSNKDFAGGLPEFIVPFCTPPFDLRIAGESDPHWNQEFLLDQDAAYLLRPEVVILFEVLDFNFKLIKAESTLLRKDKFYPVAWGFLRPAGHTKMNLGVTKVQLYRYKFRPPPTFNETRRPEVFYDFNWFRKELYPSFLRVELKAMNIPPTVDMPGRSLNAFEREIGIKTFEVLEQEAGQPKPKLKLGGKEEVDAQAVARAKRLTSWRRIYGEACRVPNKLAYKLESCHLGCFRLAFAHSGKYLAAACTAEDTVIKVYQVEDGDLALTLRGHADLVHDLAWSENDLNLLSSSADGTTKLWDFTSVFASGGDAAGFSAVNFNPGTADFLLGNMNHPSYVYCARFHPEDKIEDKDIIATACFDGKVRIWLVNHPSNKSLVERSIADLASSQVLATIDITPDSVYDYESIMSSVYRAESEEKGKAEMERLQQESEEHERHPNYLTFDNSGQLFIADSKGMVHVWNVQLRGDRVTTTLIRQIDNEELNGDAINTLILTPPERRELLVQSRDNVIRIVEPGRGAKVTSQGLVIRRFFGAAVQKYAVRACSSPDGQFLMSGSEDGKAYMWDVASGFQSDLSAWGVACQHLVADVAWNPLYHMVAVALFGSEYPILVFTYSKTQEDVEKQLDELGAPKSQDILAPHQEQRGALAQELGATRALPKRDLF